MLTNIFGGLQALIDHVMVGRLVGSYANAGIGVASQIWIVGIVFLRGIPVGPLMAAGITALLLKFLQLFVGK